VPALRRPIHRRHTGDRRYPPLGIDHPRSPSRSITPPRHPSRPAPSPSPRHPGLDPGAHSIPPMHRSIEWMAGSGPAMTAEGSCPGHPTVVPRRTGPHLPDCRLPQNTYPPLSQRNYPAVLPAAGGVATNGSRGDWVAGRRACRSHPFVGRGELSCLAAQHTLPWGRRLCMGQRRPVQSWAGLQRMAKRPVRDGATVSFVSPTTARTRAPSRRLHGRCLNQNRMPKGRPASCHAGRQGRTAAATPPAPTAPLRQ